MYKSFVIAAIAAIAVAQGESAGKRKRPSKESTLEHLHSKLENCEQADGLAQI